MEKGCIELGRTGKHGNGGICIPLWRFFVGFLNSMLLLHTLFSCCVGGFCFSNVPRGFDARRMISGVFCALRIERGSWRLALNFQPGGVFFLLVYCCCCCWRRDERRGVK
ncbi:uncharacterized protein K444DRAFT_364690 [Hyaloscypha bicolor E]|uniref:Transmembrane protein n=1 Tax=Hyaloscypha bicolor E TaxID=1095630 RepID=A0A2J6TDS2_9HELO|nr:uncharacterized protein K444DRAFT_364690 [Hyaloscypha bicolor E]PMD61153.1 hypothetical protein K444DRAFT_364690 [Hyaloscypha bicolor E]